MGYLGDDPEAVWYNPAGIANILSQANITQHYCITMDTAQGNSIKVHCTGLPPLAFTPSHNGLYQYTPKNNQQLMTMWTHINTFTQNAEKHTQCAYKRAAKARKFQNIIMQPCSRELMDVSIKHLANCPITRQDVLAADNIFGPNLGSLKGKTVHRPNPHVSTCIDGVPPDLLNIHGNVTLCIDIMFINKIPFLVTISRDIKFGTVEALDNRQLQTITQKIQTICRLYEHRGFTITSILANPEFEPIRPMFPWLNCCGADEHVPEIE